MSRRSIPAALGLASGVLALFTVPSAEPASTPAASLDSQFKTVVQPFVQQYCVACHSGASPAAQFDLSSYTSMDMVVRDHPRWALVIDKLSSKQMPPAGMPAPTDAERQKIIGWVQAMRSEEARKHAGDPGPVLARRLSNAEYNYTIRDLTGQDIQPTKEFPIDPANQAGFDNSGESLDMSPALLNKYLQAAREVANHAVLTPDGIDFSPEPMLVETDKDKYTIQRIISFYQSQDTDFADYFAAAWRYKYRAALGHPTATLSSTAASSKVSPKYLPLVWGILEETPAKRAQEVGPIKKLQTMWRALPAPGAAKAEPAREQFTAMRDWVVRLRLDTGMQYATPVVKGLPGASEALMDWKLQMFADHRRDSDPNALRNDEDPAPVVAPIPRYPGLHQDGAPHWAAVINKSRAEDQDLVVPKAQRAKYEQSFARFANVFPDQFYASERGRYFPDDSQDKGRLLSAGYHNVMGYYRDDTALQQLVLNDAQIKQLNRLWTEFDFIAEHTSRTFVQFYFNQSGEVYGRGDEGGSPRPADHAVTDEPIIMKLKADYLAKAAEVPTNSPIAPGAITEHFDRINATLRNLEKMHAEAEPKHLVALQKLAAKAYRRPLTKAENDDIVAFYHQLRDKEGLSHEDAIRDSIVSILMSPDFTYRFDLAPTSTSSGQTSKTGAAKMIPASMATPSSASVPLTNYELASRLSYFIWSSMPDDELMAHAAKGDLQNPVVLLSEVRRMMKDDKVRDFATEFGGNWLQFRHFETWNGVDRNRFPNFTNDLREAMFEEPVRFIGDVMQHNKSVLDMLYGDYTFVNPALAKFYGMNVPEFALAPPPPAPKGGGRGVLPADAPAAPKFLNAGVTDNTWVKIDDASEYQRGGLIPMAVFLTQNSPGLRTSPVKRGHWMVTSLLGETIPAPPPNVPALPNDEAQTNAPIKELLSEHRKNPMCAQCHTRFDVFGLTMEGYGPVGEARTKDLAGRTVDPSATLPGNVEEAGFKGVQEYIKEHRQKGFIDGMTRKLLSYALDRSLILSDEPLVAKMEARLAANGYRFDSLVETIVTSPQFRNKRSAEPAEKSAPSRAESTPADERVAENKKGM
ncbi:MAG TPA: DUF1592 domain-containing protein [Bryobacteraceae bacterium]|nr:DUF1592 domain-containing protein [Bryobacteraceae bacterium]